MIDLNACAIVATASLTGLAMLLAAALIVWRGWLELKHRQISGEPSAAAASPSAGARIEIADLKERIRKLEALAAGVDL